MGTDYTAQNRRAWNEIAPVRAERWAAKHPDDQILRGETLAADVRRTAGDVAGRPLLHLQCASGEDSLSWAALGADVTAIDIAERLLEPARARASRLGLDVRFVAADVLDLPDDLQRGSFDIVYTGGGVLSWLPALEPWATGIERALTESGLLVLEEEHPLAQTLVVKDGAVEMEDDYFQRGRVEEEPAGWSHFDDQGTATESKYEFVWPLGDVVTALAGAGLRVERLEEFPAVDDQLWRYQEAMDAARSLPGWFLLTARNVEERTVQQDTMPGIEIRLLDADTVPILQDAFCVPGWNKPREQYSRYLEQHESGEIVCLVAWVGDELAGYVKIVWEPSYEPLAAEGIPEIQDLNVLEGFRRRGVATRLLDRAEEEVSKRSEVVGIGVGLHPGYNAAQRLYVLRGYVPDGRGVTYGDRYVQEGEQVPFDDSLALNFTKELR